MKHTMPLRHRMNKRPCQPSHRPRLEAFEDRLPLGDALLGALLGSSLIAPSLVDDSSVFDNSADEFHKQAAITPFFAESRNPGQGVRHLSFLDDALKTPPRDWTASGKDNGIPAGAPRRPPPDWAVLTTAAAEPVRKLGFPQGDGVSVVTLYASSGALGGAALGVVPDHGSGRQTPLVLDLNSMGDRVPSLPVLNLPGRTTSAARLSNSNAGSSKTNDCGCDLVFEANILQLQDALTHGLITSHQLVECYLARIQAYDQQGPALNAISNINPKALAEADALDAERAEHGSRGPLHGIPILLKDNFDTTELPTTVGSLLFKDWYSGNDAFQWQKLRDAGAILLATANMDEFARGEPRTYGSGFGQTHNPYDLTRYPAGSSGGTGAAIAANFAAVGMGTDTGGSIRGPATVNNLAGLRPTRGLSSRSGIFPNSHTQDVAGPIGRTVADIAVMLDATVGYDPNDPITQEGIGHVPHSYTDFLRPDGLSGARIGIVADRFGNDPDVRNTVRRALGEATAYGAEVVEVLSTAALRDGPNVFNDESRDDINAYLAQHPEAPVRSLQEIIDSGLYHAGVRESLVTAQNQNDPEGYAQRLVRRETVKAEALRLMDDNQLDALAYAGWSKPQPIGTFQGFVAGALTLSVVTGLPELYVPAGFTDDGLPAGIALVGRPFSEPRLIEIAYSYEQATHHRRPPASTPPLGCVPGPGPQGSASAHRVGAASTPDGAGTPIGPAPQRSTPGPSARLVKNISSATLSSNPANLTNVNGTLFFTATTPETGTELWKSDGTAEGTVLVKDILPGPGDSTPSNLTNVGGTLFFTAFTPDTGTELWKSDGTPEGTVMVKDIYPGPTGAFGTYAAGDLTAVDGTLFFVAAAPGLGLELWKSDGTADGTVLVKDINPGGPSSSPRNLTKVGHTLFFTAFTPETGRELWKSDGTADGTVMVKDIYPGHGSSPDNLTDVGGTLFFAATDRWHGRELWKSDGTASGTVLVLDIFPGPTGSSPDGLSDVNGTLFFAATGPTTGRQLWKSDGTPEGTVLVRAIVPDGGSSSPTNLTNVGGTLFFAATTPETGTELWKSDGTRDGTVLVRDINPGSASSSPSNLTDVSGTLFFTATEPTTGTELWKSDGTAEGTVLVRDINPGTASSSPSSLVKVGGTLFFAATEPATGRELWKSDGTADGTVLVKDINSDGADASPQFLTSMDGTLFFAATQLSTGTELWKSDGTLDGTVLVRDIVPGAGSSSPTNLTAVGSTLFFSASTPATGTQLWKSDGTADGTVLVKQINPGSAGSDPANLTDVNGTLFFTAFTAATGTQLWKSDGTPDGTVLVKDIYPGGSADPLDLTNVNGTLFFGALAPGLGRELWKSDGTADGTVLVKDIYPGHGSFPDNLTNVGGTLFFAATDRWHGRELWKSDGTAQGTVRVLDIYPGRVGSSPTNLTAVGNMLFFAATGPTRGRELWKSDSTPEGTVLVKDINPGPGSSFPDHLTNVNGTLFFTAFMRETGTELWKSDGTADGTVLVKDIYPGRGSFPDNLTAVGDRLYFSAFEPTTGRELWTSDGTAEGTVLVTDINPGSASSFPGSLTAVGQTLFFAASEPTTGRQLWAVP